MCHSSPKTVHGAAGTAAASEYEQPRLNPDFQRCLYGVSMFWFGLARIVLAQFSSASLGLAPLRSA